MPRFSQCVPWGMVGYDELKKAHRIEAWRDRQASKPDCYPEIRRKAFIAKLHRAFIFINVPAIADSVKPWDMEEFKRRVTAAQARYLQSVAEG